MLRHFQGKVSPQSLGTQLCAGTQEAHCLQAPNVGSRQSTILGASELTVNKRLRSAASDLTASLMDKKTGERLLPWRRGCSLPLWLSGVWLLPATGLPGRPAPRRCVTGGDKKELLQTRKDEFRESTPKSPVEKRPFRNSIKRNRLPGDIGEQKTTLLRNQQEASRDTLFSKGCFPSTSLSTLEPRPMFYSSPRRILHTLSL